MKRKFISFLTVLVLLISMTPMQSFGEDEVVPAEPVLDTVISIQAIEGVTAPEKGAVPVTSIAETAEYTAEIDWSSDPETFAADTEYTATITISPKEGFTLTGVTKDFFTVAGAEATNDADSGIVKAVFPKTAPEETVPGTPVDGEVPTDGNVPETSPPAIEPETSPPAIEQETTDAALSLMMPMAAIAPVPVNAYATKDSVIIEFDKDMAVPSATEAGFSVQFIGYYYGNPVTCAAIVNSVKLDSDSADSIVLELADTVQRGDILTVSYTPGYVTAADGGILGGFNDLIAFNMVPVEIVSNLGDNWDAYDHVGWWGEDAFPIGQDSRGSEFNRHIVTTGSSVIFYGNGQLPFKDFLYCYSDEKGAKSFSFDLDLSGIKYHSMEGGGFLFNSSIYYDENPYKEYLYGYCLLFTSPNNKDFAAVLYRLDGVPLSEFCEGSGQYLNIGGGSPDIVKLGNVNLPSGFLHSIKLEVSSSTLSLWDGNTQLFDTVPLIADYGNDVGVIGSYQSHNCYELSYFKFSDLSIKAIADLEAYLAGTQAKLTFSQPVDATSVTILQSTDGAIYTTATALGTVDASSTTATVTGLEEETVYYFKLLIEGGKYDGYSRVATASGRIGDLAATPGDGKVNLTFSAPDGADSVILMQSEDAGDHFTPAAIEGTLTSSSISATVVGLTNGKEYNFKLVVEGGFHQGDSNVVSSTPTAPVVHHSSGGSSAPTPKNILHFVISDTDSYLKLGNADEKTLPMDVAPIIYEDRTLLPIRFVVEPLGGTVLWDETEQKVTITLGKTTIEMWIGNNTAKVNGVERLIDPLNANVKPMIIAPGRTMLPLRFISEALGCTVDWDAATKKITVTDWD